MPASILVPKWKQPSRHTFEKLCSPEDTGILQRFTEAGKGHYHVGELLLAQKIFIGLRFTMPLFKVVTKSQKRVQEIAVPKSAVGRGQH